jgi:lipoprotein-releasing system permease protein
LGLLRRRGTVLLRTSAVAALVAVVLGIASLVVVLSVMSGYSEVLRSGLLAAFGHAFAVFPRGTPAEVLDQATRRLAADPEVVAAGGVLLAPGMITTASGGRVELVTVRGGATQLAGVTLPLAGPGGALSVAVGSGVARRLGVSVGGLASLQMVVDGKPRALPVRLTSVFHSGFTDIDERWLAIRLDELVRRLPGARPAGVEIRLRRPEEASLRRPELEKLCGNGVLVATWEESNANLFAALKWQKLSLAMVLSLVLGVAAFEVASALVVLVTEKRRSIGVLLALGSPPSLVRRTMMLAGAALGGAGVLAGLVVGLVVVAALRLAGIPHFPPEIATVYMVERIPLLVLPGDLALVLTLGIGEVVLASLIPAFRAASRDPAEVLRWV